MPRRGTHYYSEHPSVPERQQAVAYGDFSFTTGSGVFGISKIDRGSEVLIKAAIIHGTRVLDLGCGYGPIGIILAREHPDVEFLLTDINRRAMLYARDNIKANKIKNADAKQSDGYKKIEGTFDVILLNPPQSAGKAVCEMLISGSKEFLNKGGSLQVVVRRNKGGVIIEKMMLDTFANIDVLAKKSGYWVYRSVKE